MPLFINIHGRERNVVTGDALCCPAVAVTILVTTEGMCRVRLHVREESEVIDCSITQTLTVPRNTQVARRVRIRPWKWPMPR